MPSTVRRRRGTGHRASWRAADTFGAARAALRRFATLFKAPQSVPDDEEPIRRRWSEIVSSASVILAGVLVVIGFGFVASRAMRSETTPPNLPVPQAPTVGDVALPTTAVPSQGPISLGTPSPSPSPSGKSSASSSPAPGVSTSDPPPPDRGAATIAVGAVPGTVDLTAEGSSDWVHWGLDGTFSLERDKQGNFAILEGAPTAPRFKQALSPQQFRWTGGDPVDHSDGTTTGIRTCGAGNGFTLSVPAGTKSRVLRLYVGVVAARGRLDVKLSPAGSAGASTTIQQKDGTFRTAVFTIRYRATKTAKLSLKWNTEAVLGPGCAGVALQAATLQ